MQIEHGEKLFEFTTFDNWLDTAEMKFEAAGMTGKHVVCVDQKGRICRWGAHFMVARDDKSFPVEVFRFRNDKQ